MVMNQNSKWNHPQHGGRVSFTFGLMKWFLSKILNDTTYTFDVHNKNFYQIRFYTTFCKQKLHLEHENYKYGSNEYFVCFLTPQKRLPFQLKWSYVIYSVDERSTSLLNKKRTLKCIFMLYFVYLELWIHKIISNSNQLIKSFSIWNNGEYTQWSYSTNLISRQIYKTKT